MFTFVRSLHDCPICNAPDVAVGLPENPCENCNSLLDRGWTFCPRCDRLAMEPLAYLDQCSDCCDDLDRIAEAHADWELEQEAIAAFDPDWEAA